MTADQCAIRQAQQETRAHKAPHMLEALSAKCAYIEVGKVAIERREVTGQTVGGADCTELLWVVTDWGVKPNKAEGFETLAEAIEHALGEKQ